jgi:Mycothiol maleylpyruvate isomerase N-terminal domain
MTLDGSFVQLNRASTERIRRLLNRLSDAEMQHPVTGQWTVVVTLVHLAFWDRRVMFALDMTQEKGELVTPEIDLLVNDLSVPLWAAVPPREAGRLALETADVLDKRLEAFPEPLLEQLFQYNKRWVVRAMHRGEHLDEVDLALKA